MLTDRSRNISLFVILLGYAHLIAQRRVQMDAITTLYWIAGILFVGVTSITGVCVFFANPDKHTQKHSLLK